MIRARGNPKREGGCAVDRHAAAGRRDIAQQQVVRRVFLVDEDDVLDLPTGLPRLIGNRVVGGVFASVAALVALVVLVPLVVFIALVVAVAATALGEAVIRVDTRRVCVQLLRVWQ